jgi:CRISPR/Cas system-associated endoribonuclease Cas2
MLVLVTYDDVNTETFESRRRLRNEAKMGPNLGQHMQKSVLSGETPRWADLRQNRMPKSD